MDHLQGGQARGGLDEGGGDVARLRGEDVAGDERPVGRGQGVREFRFEGGNPIDAVKTLDGPVVVEAELGAAFPQGVGHIFFPNTALGRMVDLAYERVDQCIGVQVATAPLPTMDDAKILCQGREISYGAFG